ncbi:MAG: ribosome assembly factor SBDS [Candidatus Diapherotrites archaeon CG10_big_fil_rev_8_21_14_0_10_31_34]|nr:MAG: ribosome assembly factor SBDS [Candidatus Diapherotrites archaeon CG10_big_fil_rev_8_21_14_0_10_31_34]
MVKVSDAVIARYEKEGEKFEILVDPDLSMDLKKGKTVDFNQLMAIDTIFKDSNKGTEASPETITKVFGTTEIEKVAEKIIRDGRVQLTTDQRKKMLEQRRKELIDFISRNAINPQTKTPHPPKRIENILEEAKIHVDPMKTVQEQLPEIMGKIKKLIPISMEKIKIAFKIPAEHAGKATHVLHKYGLKQEEWQSDGSLVAVLELPAGAKEDLLNDLNHLTKGNIESKIMD